MGLFEKLNNYMAEIANRETEDREKIGDTATKKVDSLMKDLSGRGIGAGVRMPDNVVAFIGASGGVGNSTIVSNVAYTIGKMGKSVMILDLNVLNPIQHNYLRSQSKLERGHDLVGYLTGRCSLGECIINAGGGISLISATSRNIVEYIYADNDKSSDAIQKAISRLRQLFDIIIIDAPQSLIVSDIVSSALYSSDIIYTVWDENIACIQGTENLMVNLNSTGIHYDSKMKGIIFNKRTYLGYPKQPIISMGLEIISVLPLEIGVIQSGLDGQVYVRDGIAVNKHSKVYCREINKLARQILSDCSTGEDVKIVEESV